MGRRRMVFLIDVDNTLLDNDRVAADLRRYLEREVGPARQRRYWAHFEGLRRELGYADYLGALQRYRRDYPRDPNILPVSSFLIDYPFAKRLFPRALDVLKRLSRRGTVVILTDGDVVFQPHKIERSGIAKAVRGRILIYIHKERELRDIERRCPADHYVLVDDKPRIIDAVKKAWKDKVTTIFVRQGHYARARPNPAGADIRLARIADMLKRGVSGPRGSWPAG